MKKNIFTLSLIICITTILLSIASVASAEIIFTDSCGESAIGILDDNGTLTISGEGEITSVTMSTLVKNVIITEGITSIGSRAFAYCSPTNITICEGVTSIGYDAFLSCKSLKSITIPNSVTSIGSSIFAECTSIEEITLPFIGPSRESNGTDEAVFGYFFGCGKNTGTLIDQYYSSTDYVRYRIPPKLKKVTITDADIIPYGAFYGCSNLDNIILNNSINIIYSKAFYNCSNLMDITILSQSVKTPNSNIFTGCDMLTIHGIEGSNIEEYAEKYKIDFVPIDESAVGTTLTASAEAIEGNIVVTAKANGVTARKYIPVAVYDKDNTLLDLIVIPTNEDFKVIKIVFKDIKDATFVKMFMWKSYNDLVPLETAQKVDIVRN